jgi:AmmeMemoRadiSam system protein B
LEREPIVAGKFYEGDKARLACFLDNHLQVEEHEHDCGKVALIVPHAPYRQSGFVMARGYGFIKDSDIAVILCPNHSGLGHRASVARYERWRCPIGALDLDEALSSAVVHGSRMLKFDNIAHEEEHAIEVQIPILCHINPRMRIVPICLKWLSFADCEEIGEAIACAIAREQRRVVIIATSDFSHGEPFLVALKNDRLAIERILHLDYDGLYEAVIEHDITMCGLIPVVVALSASKRLGAMHAYLVAYSTTAETSNDRSSVVGFASMILTKKRLFRAQPHLTDKWRNKDGGSEHS